MGPGPYRAMCEAMEKIEEDARKIEDDVVSVTSLFSNYERSYSNFISDKFTREFDYSPAFRHVLESNVLNDFLNTVPIRLAHITATPGQVFSALWANARLPTEVVSLYVTTERTGDESAEERKRMRMPAHRFVQCKINTVMPGSGKTAQAILSSLPPLLSASVFDEFKADAAQKFPYAFHAKSLGLEDGYAKPLVRTVIFATTQATKKQTTDAVKTFLAGTGVEVWNEVAARTLQTAYETNNNSPKVWVLPTNATLWGFLRNSEQYQFVGIIYDELNFSSSGRGNQAEPLSTLILQATPDALRHSRSGTVNALVGRMDPNSSDSWINYVHACLPESVRALVNRGALEMMPRHVHRYEIRCKLTSVFGSQHESNALVPLSLESYLLKTLEPHASDRSRITMENFKLLASKLRGVIVTIPFFASILKDSMAMVPFVNDPDVDGRIRARRRILERLVGTVEGILDGGSDCPVLLEPLTIETANILPCCGNIISFSAAEAVHRTTGRCPLCREKLEIVSGLGSVAEEPVKTCPRDTVNLGAPTKDVATLAAARLPPLETIVGIMSSIIFAIPGARIILCASELALGVSQASEDLLAMLAKYAPTAIVCSTLGKKKFKASDFNDKKKFKAPRILLLDLSIRSSNAAGLDLPSSEATILLGGANRHLLAGERARTLAEMKNEIDRFLCQQPK